MHTIQLKVIQTKEWSIFHTKKLPLIHVAFFLLFPGFFFYQTLIGVGAIDAFLGGYFSVVSIALLAPLLFVYFQDVGRAKNFFMTTDFYYVLFLLYFSVTVVIHFATGADSKLVFDHLASIVHMLNLFIIFKMIDANERTFRIVTLLSLGAMSAIVFYFSIDGFFDLRDDALINAAVVATYQGFARSYLLTFIVAMACYRKPATRILWYALGIATLFTNGARSEFAAMLALIPLIELYHARNKALVLMAIACFLLLFTLLFHDIIRILPDSRILELADLSQSTSVSTRHYLTERALKTIAHNPILGDYGSYATGAYSHNVLSAWVDLGLLGFLYLLAILLWPACELIVNGFFKKDKSSEFLMAASLIFVTILLLASSHYFTDMLIGAALGAYARHKYVKRARPAAIYDYAHASAGNERAAR